MSKQASEPVPDAWLFQGQIWWNRQRHPNVHPQAIAWEPGCEPLYLTRRVPSEAKAVQEWAVRHGDGEVQEFGDAHTCEVMIAAYRMDIASGRYDAEDYEPMSIVARTVTTHTTDWEEAVPDDLPTPTRDTKGES